MRCDPCVPFTPFGRQNSAAAIDYVSHNSIRTHTKGQRTARQVEELLSVEVDS